MKDALIFDIQPFSLHDGPGIRTLIFFKGCSLACKWCANPEGIEPVPEIKQNPLLCIGCGACLKSCPSGAISTSESGIVLDRRRCKRCGACVRSCPSKAISWWGESVSIEQLVDAARRDSPFYSASGGGVTLGGGDPLLQNEQAVELLRRCKQMGLNTAIETAGNYPWDYLERAIPYCDTIHFDLKGWDPEKCLNWFGSDNVRIKDNLRRLDEALRTRTPRPRLIVRIPLLPGENYTLEEFERAGEFLCTLKAVSGIEILPFHNLGEGKYGQLGKPYALKGRTNLKTEDAEPYLYILQDKKLPVTITTM